MLSTQSTSHQNGKHGSPVSSMLTVLTGTWCPVSYNKHQPRKVHYTYHPPCMLPVLEPVSSSPLLILSAMSRPHNLTRHYDNLTLPWYRLGSHPNLSCSVLHGTITVLHRRWVSHLRGCQSGGHLRSLQDRLPHVHTHLTIRQQLWLDQTCISSSRTATATHTLAGQQKAMQRCSA